MTPLQKHPFFQIYVILNNYHRVISVCAGDPMMTEPDLVTIEDFVGVDDASLIAHINTRGIFRLVFVFVLF